MQKWEYLTVKAPNDAELQKLGEEGWELASTYAAAPPGFIVSFIYFVFKRPKP